MNTILDTQHELELKAVSYDGEGLVSEVSGLARGERHRVVPDGTRYLVTFSSPVMHLVIEEFPAAVAAFVQGEDTGFLKVLKNNTLREALGVNVEPFESHDLFALITAHEVLIVLCRGAPLVEMQA